MKNRALQEYVFMQGTNYVKIYSQNFGRIIKIIRYVIKLLIFYPILSYKLLIYK
jgi:hypothetical protein